MSSYVYRNKALPVTGIKEDSPVWVDIVQSMYKGSFFGVPTGSNVLLPTSNASVKFFGKYFTCTLSKLFVKQTDGVVYRICVLKRTTSKKDKKILKSMPPWMCVSNDLTYFIGNFIPISLDEFLGKFC